MKSWIVLAVIILLLLGGCSAIEGGTPPPYTSLIAVAMIVGMKVANDRIKLLAWPMEFLLAAAVTMIVLNLIRLYYMPLPY
jgi:uncharacterized protein YceK